MKINLNFIKKIDINLLFTKTNIYLRPLKIEVKHLLFDG